VDILAQQMKWCVAHPDEVALFGDAARQKASQWQWPQYKKELAETIFNKWQKFEKAKQSV
jgi:hypothetical protein